MEVALGYRTRGKCATDFGTGVRSQPLAEARARQRRDEAAQAPARVAAPSVARRPAAARLADDPGRVGAARARGQVQVAPLLLRRLAQAPARPVVQLAPPPAAPAPARRAALDPHVAARPADLEPEPPPRPHPALAVPLQVDDLAAPVTR
ncbi:hypothetical protein FIBSPDRAFT_953513 [Athelia psychrophila]|uniref:Uncharacterized protein n=1 Tax=Athelia psychrophila TaxID=1759441 RepID=A0A166KC79_9AGAM|nr:hypothetical protein FIBSPDRAFT_953513 [Fibularhizoctonia sp. CBS 109695]